MVDYVEKVQPISKLTIRLWQHIGHSRRVQFGFLLVLMIFAAFAEMLSIGAVLPFLGALTQPNRIFEHSAMQPFIEILGLTSADQLILPLTIAFCLAALIAAGMRLLLLWVSVRLSFAFGSDLGNKLYRHTLYQSYETHIARNSSEIINGISKVNAVIFYMLMPAMTLISASIMVIAIMLVLWAVIPAIALAAFGSLGLAYAIIIKLSRKRLKINSQHEARESTNVLKTLQEGLSGIRDILIDGSQENFCNSYRNIDHVLRRAQGNNQIMSHSPRYALEAMGMLLMAMLAYVLSHQANGIATAIPTLAALALGLQRLLPATQQLYGAWSNIQGAHTSLQDVLELLDQPLPEHAEQPSAEPIPFRHQITLNQISFRYSSQTPWVCKDINLAIAKGARVGFIGATGCGKSTLLDIVMGLLLPTEGVIEIDDQPITMVNRRSWQAHIAHVPQTIFLADSSIEENIAFGVPKELIDSGRVRQAAQQAQLAEIIETWPSKYQTCVGERGVQLSGGQRQRIGIARALYKQADVIVFDEATSALDSETEQAVMFAIESLSEDITILIIAHRLNTLRGCTEVFELGQDGVINREVLSE